MEFLSSDSWILLSIILTSRKGSAKLEEILSAADGINHAIPTFEEVEGALARLTAGGFIHQNGDLFLLTKKTEQIFDAQSRYSVHAKWKKLEKFLDAKTWDKTSSPMDANIGVSYDGISREMFEQAVNLYLDKARHTK